MLNKTLFCAAAVLPMRIPSVLLPLLPVREISSRLLFDPSTSIAGVPDVVHVSPWMPRVSTVPLMFTHVPTFDIERLEYGPELFEVPWGLLLMIPSKESAVPIMFENATSST